MTSAIAVKRKLLRGSDMIAKRLGVSRRTVYAWQQLGLPVFKVGRATSPLCGYSDELQTWFERNRQVPVGNDFARHEIRERVERAFAEKGEG